MDIHTYMYMFMYVYIYIYIYIYIYMQTCSKYCEKADDKLEVWYVCVEARVSCCLPRVCVCVCVFTCVWSHV